MENFSLRLRYFFVITMLLTGCCAGVADRDVTAQWLKEAPDVDGDLGDSVWQEGEWCGAFRVLGESGKLSSQKTEFKIAYTDTHMYLAAKVPYSGRLNINEFSRDGLVFEDDSLFLMLDPYSSGQTYYVFIVNAVGVQYDAKRTQSGRDDDLSWNRDWVVATKIKSNVWTLEMAIPLGVFRIDERVLGSWKFNVARKYRGEGGVEYSTFSPDMKYFHEPNSFSTLNMPNFTIERYLWNIRLPISDCYVTTRKGKCFFSGKVLITNKGSEENRFKLAFKQISSSPLEEVSTITGEVEKGDQMEYDISFPVEREDPLLIEFKLLNRDNEEDIYRVETGQVTVSYDPVDLQVLEPGYRGNIYLGEKFSIITMKVNFALPPKILEGCHLKFSLKSKRTGAIVAESTVEVFNKDTYYLPVGGLSVGRYELKAELEGKDGEALGSASKKIKKVRVSEHSWHLENNRGLFHNKEPFLPYGWGDVESEDIEGLKGMPITSLFKLRSDSLSDVEIKEYLDRAHRVGINVVMSPFLDETMVGTKRVWSQLLTEREREKVKKQVRNFKNHPALMAWCIAYKPELDTVSKKRLEQVYEVIEEEDPFHPCVVVSYEEKRLVECASVGDILMPSVQGLFYGKDQCAKSFARVNKYVSFSQRLRQRNQSVWVVMQAFDYKRVDGFASGGSSLLDLRNILFQAVIGGAQGFFWNDYKDTVDFPEVAKEVSFLGQEVLYLNAFIAEPSNLKRISISCPDPKTIHCLEKEVDGKGCIFSVNTGGDAQKVRFKAPGYENKRLYVLSEGRSINVSAKGIFEDYYGPRATHVYLTERPSSEGTSLAAVEAEISRLRSKSEKLAFKPEFGIRKR